MSSNSIVFLGSGPVALQSLELLKDDFSIEAIITKPATLRDMQHAFPQVPVHAVANRQALEDLIAGGRFRSQLAVLIDFGIIVSRPVIDAFALGIINSHFSLLPEWRGADPITFTVLSGQRRTGVSLMLLTEGLDEGPLLAQAAYDVTDNMTTPLLTEALIDLSHAMLRTIIPAYIRGECVAVPQLEATIANTTPTYSRKLTKADGIIDWTKPAPQLAREIRAFIGWPKSRTNLAGKEVIVTAARAHDLIAAPGKVVLDGKHLIVGCGQGSLEIERLKPAGKADMPATAFLAGYKQFL